MIEGLFMGMQEPLATNTVPGSRARFKNLSAKEGNSSRNGSLINSLETPVKKKKNIYFRNPVGKEIPKSSLTKRYITECQCRLEKKYAVF